MKPKPETKLKTNIKNIKVTHANTDNMQTPHWKLVESNSTEPTVLPNNKNNV